MSIIVKVLVSRINNNKKHLHTSQETKSGKLTKDKKEKIEKSNA